MNRKARASFLVKSIFYAQSIMLLHSSLSIPCQAENRDDEVDNLPTGTAKVFRHTMKVVGRWAGRSAWYEHRESKSMRSDRPLGMREVAGSNPARSTTLAAA